MDAMDDAPAVRLRGVTKTYSEGSIKVDALRGVSFEIPRRRFAIIVGPSGSGKTTLLNLIGCIDIPTSGQIEVCGSDTNAFSDNKITDFRARKIAFIFQNFNLYPVLTAYENVEYPLLLIGMPTKQRHERVVAMLESVGLYDQQRQRPNQLSGGQKQRVAIARALVKQPEIVLADEPTANLDSHTGQQIVDLMRKVQCEQKVSFIFSSHDSHLISYAEETFVIRDGELVEHRKAIAS